MAVIVYIVPTMAMSMAMSMTMIVGHFASHSSGTRHENIKLFANLWAKVVAEIAAKLVGIY